jgi:hypothetical protein
MDFFCLKKRNKKLQQENKRIFRTIFTNDKDSLAVNKAGYYLLEKLRNIADSGPTYDILSN